MEKQSRCGLQNTSASPCRQHTHNCPTALTHIPCQKGRGACRAVRAAGDWASQHGIVKWVEKREPLSSSPFPGANSPHCRKHGTSAMRPTQHITQQCRVGEMETQRGTTGASPCQRRLPAHIYLECAASTRPSCWGASEYFSHTRPQPPGCDSLPSPCIGLYFKWVAGVHGGRSLHQEEDPVRGLVRFVMACFCFVFCETVTGGLAACRDRASLLRLACPRSHVCMCVAN
jgi:hypothetical protein